MHTFADSFTGITLQVVLSLLLTGVAVYSASGWVERQNPRDIEPAPVRYFLGLLGWRPLLWGVVLSLSLPVYAKYDLVVLGLTHILVTGLYWIHRMLVCGQWRLY